MQKRDWSRPVLVEKPIHETREDGEGGELGVASAEAES
jgi:hypothetical protein